jgi:hypothetical protein
MAFVLFSAMRNEGPFLFDWIAYHKSIGFDQICIVTNDCTDGSYPLLKKLSDAGVIVHIDQNVPKGVSPQKSAVEHAEKMTLLTDGDWAIFLDADEYLNVKLGNGKVSDLAKYLDGRGLQGMLVNWKLFGDSGQDHFENSYIDEAFIQCEAASACTQFKTFFRVGAVARGFSPFLHRCLVVPNVGKLSDFIVGSGGVLGAGAGAGPKALRRHKAWLHKGDDPFATLQNDEIGYDIAQVNHYIVRDPASFQLKKARGRGYKPRSKRNARHTDAFYEQNNKNSAVDRSILRHRGALNDLKRGLIMKLDLAATLGEIHQRYLDAINFESEKPMTSRKQPPVTGFSLSFPEEEKSFVRTIYSGAKAIIEYGSGGSTCLAAELGVACVSVESDGAWAARLNATLCEIYGENTSAVARHIDIGATKEWGYPRNRRRSGEYWRYPLEVWNDPIAEQADTVLIDGRFRKACFAATLMNAQHEMTVLFDDYKSREFYHEVELLVKPVRMVGRMAEFVVSPGLISSERFAAVIPWFAEVR